MKIFTIIGYEEDERYENVVDLIENTDGFDVVLDAHSHSVIENIKLTDEEVMRSC